MGIQEDIFFKIYPGSRIPTECTPEIDDLSFRGIKINAPQKVFFSEGETVDRFGSFALFPICMIYQFDSSYFLKFDNLTDHMIVVAVNEKTGESFSGNLADEDPVAPYEKLASPEELADMVQEGYLNFNLIQFVNIPPRNATYNIFVILEKYKSNVVTVVFINREKINE